MTSTSSALDKWVAESDDDWTTVEAPIMITEFADSELRDYHPQNPMKGACRFTLIKSGDGSYAVANVNEDDPWTTEFKSLMKQLKLRIRDKGKPTEHLLDDTIGNANVFMGATGWKAVKWRIDRFADDNGPILREWITWENKDGRIAETFYGWIPYAALQ